MRNKNILRKMFVIVFAVIMLIMTAACGYINNGKNNSANNGSSSELTIDNSSETDEKSQEQSGEKTGEADDKSTDQTGKQSGDKPGQVSEKSGETAGQTGGKDKAEVKPGEAIKGDSAEQSNEKGDKSNQKPDEDSLMAISNEVLELMKKQDFNELSKYIHEQKGVRFTPYSSVDKKIDRGMTAGEIAGFADDNKKYIWGYYDGSGFDMSLTNMEYWDQFVWNTDYTAAENVNINKIVQIGNSIENLTEEYPDASFVEYHFSQLEAKYEGMDWCALRLVFEDYEGEWKLVAVIHAQWTI